MISKFLKDSTQTCDIKQGPDVNFKLTLKGATNK